MTSTAAGVVLAVLAAAAFEGSYVLQTLQARALPTDGRSRAGLLARLARRPGWLLAIGLSVLGFALQVLALHRAPLSVVQPVLTLGLVGLLALAVRVLGEPLRARDVAGTAAVVLGVVAVVAAAPQRGGPAATGPLLGACAVLALIALVPFAIRRSGGLVLVAAAGTADALAALAINEVARTGTLVSLTALAWAAAAAAAGLAGLTSETAALQRRRATSVAPLVLGAQVAIPVGLAPLVAGEDWTRTPGGGALIVAGLVLVCLGAAALGASPGLERLRHPEDEVGRLRQGG